MGYVSLQIHKLTEYSVLFERKYELPTEHNKIKMYLIEQLKTVGSVFKIYCLNFLFGSICYRKLLPAPFLLCVIKWLLMYLM